MLTVSTCRVYSNRIIGFNELTMFYSHSERKPIEFDKKTDLTPAQLHLRLV